MRLPVVLLLVLAAFSTPLAAAAQPPAPAAQALMITVTTDRPAYGVGEVVTFTITLTNPAPTAVTVALTSSPYTLTVTDERGTVVHRAPPARTLAISERTLAPGEVLTFTERWAQQRLSDRQPVPPGRYTAAASLTPPLAGSSAPVSFEVGAGRAGGAQSAPVRLAPGCNNVTLTWPDGTPPDEVAAAVTPPAALVAMWRFDAARQAFQAFAPQFPQASELTTVNRLDAVFLCMGDAGTLTRPVI